LELAPTRIARPEFKAGNSILIIRNLFGIILNHTQEGCIHSSVDGA